MDPTARPSELSVEIRPDVRRPDWSAITEPQARRALAGRLASRAGLLNRWAVKLGDDEDLLWRTILWLYVELGCAPTRTEMAARTGVPDARLSTLLASLRSHDLIDLDDVTGEVMLAYPFTEAATGHRIHFGKHTLNALCAIDALGVAAMYRRGISISSRCHQCGSPIHVETRAQGERLRSTQPRGAVVWYDFAYDGSAASSCCPAIAFFCSEEHRREWCGTQSPPRAGIDLTMGEATQVGSAIFGPILMPG
jgi:hypothetical protein